MSETIAHGENPAESMDAEPAARQSPCPFCTNVLSDPEQWLAQRAHAVSFKDAFPSAEGHTLVIPRRHVGRVSDLSLTEFAELWELAYWELRHLEKTGPADAYTIGINDGPAAGQTVAHVHLHIVPRHHGDVPDPRGGIRWVLPQTAAYWT